MRTSSTLKLPSQCTLRDYTHYIKSSCKFSNEVDNDFIIVADYYHLEDWQKYVAILIEEMHIIEDDKHTGALIGLYLLEMLTNSCDLVVIFITLIVTICICSLKDD